MEAALAMVLPNCVSVLREGALDQGGRPSWWIGGRVKPL